MRHQNMSLLCSVRIHNWFRDSAYFSSANCCSRCGHYQNPVDQKRLEFERFLWEKETTGSSVDFFEASARIMSELAKASR